MSGTEPMTTDGGTTGTTETRDDASSAAERLGGPLEDEQSRDELGRDEQTRDELGRDEQTRDELGRDELGRDELGRDEQTRDELSRDELGRDELGRDEQTRDELGRDEQSRGEQSRDTASEAETHVARRADSTGGEGDQIPDAASKAQTDADRQADTGVRQRATLIEPERAESYNSRWNELKSEFVDDPRRSVRGANELVGEVLDELEELFRGQRADLEHGLDSEQTTTEDLRQALGRYRSFFDRLLSF
jgi:hypothetical protein